MIKQRSELISNASDALDNQQTRFEVFVVVGDGNCHVGLCTKCSKEFATAIHGAIILIKLSVILAGLATRFRNRPENS